MKNRWPPKVANTFRFLVSSPMFFFFTQLIVVAKNRTLLFFFYRLHKRSTREVKTNDTSQPDVSLSLALRNYYGNVQGGGLRSFNPVPFFHFFFSSLRSNKQIGCLIFVITGHHRLSLSLLYTKRYKNCFTPCNLIFHQFVSDRIEWFR